MTMVGSAITAASVDPAITAGPVTAAASVDPATTVGLATMAEATTAEAAATTKPLPAQATVAARDRRFCASCPEQNSAQPAAA
jgi:hypothetical protein